MFNVGPTELMLILVLALIVFGPKKLPEMGKSIGKGLREFRKAQMDIRREISEGMRDVQTPGTNGSTSAGGASTPSEATASPDASPTEAPVADGQGAAVPDGQGTSQPPTA